MTSTPNLVAHSHTSAPSSQITSILRATATSSFAVVPATQAFHLPPTPLTSFLSVAADSEQVAGAVLAGYDEAFLDTTFLDTTTSPSSPSLLAITNAATIAARAALADSLVSPSTAVPAAVALAASAIPEIPADDEEANNLFHCFFENGECPEVLESVQQEKDNSLSRLNHSPSFYHPLQTPPNYFVNVFSPSRSQPFVVVSGNVYGGFDDVEGFLEEHEKGRAHVQLQPSALEATIHRLLSTYLNSTGGTVQYHTALDTGVAPMAGSHPTFYEVVEGVTDTPMWTEPNWETQGLAVFMDGEGWSYGEPFYLAGGLLLLAGSVLFGKALVARLRKSKQL